MQSYLSNAIILGNDVSGVYKYPQNCEKSNCVYFVEWKTFGEHVHFTIITELKDSISVGLSTAEHSVSPFGKIDTRITLKIALDGRWK